MKKTFFNFIRHGLMACGLGPLILAVLYLILQHQYHIETLTATEVCIGIISVSVFAFIAGGINEIYQIERLPLVFSAIFVFGNLGCHLFRHPSKNRQTQCDPEGKTKSVLMVQLYFAPA